MRILVVEDEPRIGQSLKKGLEQEGYAVDLAATGDHGYDLASSEQYDLILLDRMIPGMDGVTVCKTLRDEHNTTPILFLTAKTQIHERVEGLDAGADDYLIKPFSFDELLARVRALIRRPPVTNSSVLRVQDLVLDTAAHTVRQSQKTLLLSSKEFSVLEYLMRMVGKTVSKQQLTEHVWDYDADILPNTVEVTIRNLRKKLHDEKGKIGEMPRNSGKYIQTIRGFGYTMDKDKTE
jgi:DNA-binding response OmpR family regulator